MTSSSPPDFSQVLNPAQLAAATADAGPHLVIAGAGSGKTRTLVYRVAHLVSSGTPPESILLLTFTRRAAQEMLRRATTILDERCRRVAGGTYHSFANLVLRRHAKRLGYASSFTIADRSDAIDLMGILRTEGGYERQGRRFPRADTLINLVSKSVNTHRSLAEIVESELPQFEDDLPAIEKLAQAFAARKLEQSIMDYDDLLTNLRRLLVEHGAVRARLSGTYRHILVDEYQDTNRLQAQIAALLASSHGNVMVVGDDAQSIYSFRGADFRNIIDFPKLFPDAKTTVLEQNYRSTQPILDLGNAVLGRAKERYSKTLFTKIPGEQKPVFVRTLDDASQAQFLAERILTLREEGVPLSEIAILCRAAWHSNVVELELSSRNIPFRKFGGIRFVEAAHVKDVSALLRISLNPLDTSAWFRILQIFQGIGPKTAQRLIEAIQSDGGALDTLERPEVARTRYGRFLGELATLLRRLAESSLALAERLELATTTYGPWMRQKYDDAPRRQEDLESLRVIAERYEEVEPFLSDLAIDPPEVVRGRAQEDGEDEWVTVSTVHSAKGLEWQVVFVLNLNTGRFPTFNTPEGTPAFEEERRLFYVAITRAKEWLYLIKPEELSGYGGNFEIGELSPLLRELDELDQLVEEETFSPLDDPELGDPEVAAEIGDAGRLRHILDYFGEN